MQITSLFTWSPSLKSTGNHENVASCSQNHDQSLRVYSRKPAAYFNHNQKGQANMSLSVSPLQVDNGTIDIHNQRYVGFLGSQKQQGQNSLVNSYKLKATLNKSRVRTSGVPLMMIKQYPENPFLADTLNVDQINSLQAEKRNLQKKKETFHCYKKKMDEYFYDQLNCKGAQIEKAFADYNQERNHYDDQNTIEKEFSEGNQEFVISHLQFDDEEEIPQVDLDFVDLVIAEYDIELLTKFQTRKELRKYFYEQISPINYEKVYAIMKQVDMKQNNGELTLKFPKKIKNIVNEIYEKEIILNGRLMRESDSSAPTITGNLKDENGQILEWEAEEIGWGGSRQIVFDKSNGQRVIKRNEDWEDYQYLKRYLQFLKNDFRRQEIEMIENFFNAKSFEKEDYLKTGEP